MKNAARRQPDVLKQAQVALAAAEKGVKTAAHQSRLAKRKRKLAKEAVRRAKDRLKRAKKERAAARRALDVAEAGMAPQANFKTSNKAPAAEKSTSARTKKKSAKKRGKTAAASKSKVGKEVDRNELASPQSPPPAQSSQAAMPSVEEPLATFMPVTATLLQPTAIVDDTTGTL